MLPASIGIVNDRKTGGADKAWSAEQGKLACQDIDKNTEDIFDMFATVIDKSIYSEYVGWTILSSGNWQKVQSPVDVDYGCKLIPIVPGKRYRVSADVNERGDNIAILSSDSMVAQQSADFCSGYNGRINVLHGETYDFIAPEDAAYLYYCTKSSGTEYDVTIKYSDAEIPNVGEAIDEIQIAQSAIDIINSQKYGDDSNVIDWLIQSDGTWAKSSSVACVLVAVEPGKDYRIIGGDERAQFFALLASDTKAVNMTADFCDGETGRRSVPRGMTFDFTAPADCAYVYLVRKSAVGNYDGYLAIPKQINEQLSEAGIGVDARDGFSTAPEYFAWLKAEQFTKIKWTPLKGTIQKASATTKFAANTEVTGIPYSSVAEYDKRIGIDVSLHTFMTALHNPYSLIYTECVRYGYSQSAYGIQYYGPSNSGPYYGVVCSNYIDYAFGCAPYITDEFVGLLIDRGVTSIVYDQSANGVKRGDIVHQQGHVMFVKDVWRKNGVVTNVLISEEAQPQAKDRAVMTADEFNAFLSSNGRVLVRFNEIYKNIHYTPSPYVAVGDEIPETVTYNDDICTFAGDKASFAEGELIYIHCLNLSYPQMEIYKDGTLVETITLASDSRAAKTSDNLAYAVNLSNDNLAYGSYKCRLKNGGTYSDYTYFEIIDASVTIDGDTATYSSANGVAVYWYWTEYHSTDGQGMHNTTPLPGEASGTIDLTNTRRADSPLLKVLFRGEYGNVAATFMES